MAVQAGETAATGDSRREKRAACPARHCHQSLGTYDAFFAARSHELSLLTADAYLANA